MRARASGEGSVDPESFGASINVRPGALNHRSPNRARWGGEERTDEGQVHGSVTDLLAADDDYYCLLSLPNDPPDRVSISRQPFPSVPRPQFQAHRSPSLSLRLAAGLVSPDFAWLGPAARPRHVNCASYHYEATDFERSLRGRLDGAASLARGIWALAETGHDDDGDDAANAQDILQCGLANLPLRTTDSTLHYLAAVTPFPWQTARSPPFPLFPLSPGLAGGTIP